jgi:hypothetical protein
VVRAEGPVTLGLPKQLNLEGRIPLLQ